MPVIVTLPDGTTAQVDMIGPTQGELVPMWTADRQLWYNDDYTKLVEDGDLEAAHLCVGEGHMITLAEAEKFGVTKPKQKKPVDKLEDKQAATPANKQANKPADK